MVISCGFYFGTCIILIYSMFFFSYDCYVDGKLLIEMRNGVAGFFTDEELARVYLDSS